uniref:non-specific serine/threonine protein kinase n=1 Tax=Anopheles arabiensis TaxID=7173 RepID=A0A182I4U0_ANOAR
MATGTVPYHKYPPMKVLMLTLPNDQPTIDTGADEKDQYKAYGKTFRKLIGECLQKEPTKRPTASELLKHPFFKKAKDRKYLTQTLLATGPSMETRVHKAAKRQAGASGRLHRSMTGEWVWSSEEEDNGKNDSDDSETDERPMNRLERMDSSSSETEDTSERSGVTVTGSTTQPTDPKTLEATAAAVGAMSLGAMVPVNLVLRMRNANRELNDIQFEFVVGKDSAEDIAAELVGAGLLDELDVAIMSANLQKLIDHRGTLRTVTFQLRSGCAPGEQLDEKSLVGFAQISIK